MIELPEAIVLAEQMDKSLKGRRIKSAMRGNTPHKYAFYNRSPEEYSELLAGTTFQETWAESSLICSRLEPAYFLAVRRRW